MKKIFICLLAMLGVTTVCGQQNLENTDTYEVDVFQTKSGKTDSNNVASNEVENKSNYTCGYEK